MWLMEANRRSANASEFYICSETKNMCSENQRGRNIVLCDKNLVVLSEI